MKTCLSARQIKTAAACAIMMFSFAGLTANAFSVFQPFLITGSGFSNAEVSFIMTVRNLSSFAAMLLAGALFRTCTLRGGTCLAGACGGLGFILFAFAGGSLAMNCLAAFVMGISFGAASEIPMSMLAERDFPATKKLVIGASSAMTGLSTFGVPSLFTKIIETRGLGAAFLSGGTFILASAAAVYGLLHGGREAVIAGSEAQKRNSPYRPLTKAQAPLMAFVALGCGAVGFSGITHLSVLCAGEGVPPQGVAAAVSVFGLSLTAFKILYGMAAQKFGTLACHIPCGCLLVAGCLLMRFAGVNAAWRSLAMAVFAAGLTLVTVGLTVWAGDLAPAGMHGRVTRLFRLGYMGGGLLVSWLPGVIADKTGSYVPAYDGLAVLAALVTLGIVHIYRKNASAAGTDANS